MWKLKNLNWFAIALIYIAFFSLIGIAVYVTKSTSPLWGLLLTPSVSQGKNSKENKIQ